MPKHYQHNRLARRDQQHRQRELNQQRQNQANRTPEQQRETWNPNQHHLENNPIAPGLLLFMLGNSGLFNPLFVNAEKLPPTQKPKALQVEQASASQSSTTADSHSNLVDQAALLHALNQQAQSTGKSTSASNTKRSDKNKIDQEKLNPLEKDNSDLDQEQIDRILRYTAIQSAFTEAAHENISLERFSELLKAEPEITQFQDKHGNTLLHHLAKNDKKSDHIRIALRAKLKPNLTTTNLRYESPIHVALNQFNTKNILAFVEMLSQSECEKILPPLDISQPNEEKNNFIVFPVPAMFTRAVFTNANELDAVVLLNHLLKKVSYDYALDERFNISRNLMQFCFQHKKYTLLIWLIKTSIPFPNTKEKDYQTIDVLLLKIDQSDAPTPIKSKLYLSLYTHRPDYFDLRKKLIRKDNEPPAKNNEGYERLSHIIKSIPILAKNKHYQEQNIALYTPEKLKTALAEFTKASPLIKEEMYHALYFFSGDDQFNEQLDIALQSGLDGLQPIINGNSGFEAALALGQAKNFKTYFTFYIKNNPQALKNSIDDLLKTQATTTGQSLPEPLEFLIIHLDQLMGKRSIDTLETSLLLYPQFETATGMFEVIKYALQNKRLALLDWIFKRNLFFTQMPSFELQDTRLAEDPLYLSFFRHLSQLNYDPNIEPKEKDLFLDYLLKTIDGKILLNYLTQQALLEMPFLPFNKKKNQESSSILDFLIGVFEKKLGIPTGEALKAATLEKHIKSILIGASIAVPLLPLCLLYQKNSRSKAYENFLAEMSSFQNHLGIRLSKNTKLVAPTGGLVISVDEKGENITSVKPIQNVVSTATEMASIPDYPMIPVQYFPQDKRPTHLYHHQGIAYAVFKKADYLIALKTTLQTIEFPLYIQADEIMMTSAELHPGKKYSISKFVNGFISNLASKTCVQLQESDTLFKALEDLKLNELEKLIPKNNYAAKKEFGTLCKKAKSIFNHLKSVAPSIKIDQLLELVSNPIATPFEKEAASIWKIKSESIHTEISELKNRVNRLESELKQPDSKKSDQHPQIDADHSKSSPKNKRRKKHSEEAHWLYSPSSSSSHSSSSSSSSNWSHSSSSSHQTSHEDDSYSSKNTSHSTSIPTTTQEISKRSNLSTTESKAPSQNKLPQAEAINTKEKTKEKIEIEIKAEADAEITKQAPSQKQKKQVELLSNYLIQIKTLSSNAQLDETKIQALRYLLMRACVLLLALKEISQSDQNMKRIRNAFIHGLCIQDGIKDNHLLSLAKDISKTTLPLPHQSTFENEIKPALTELIDILSNSQANQAAIQLFSPWKTAKKQFEKIIDSITPFDALTRISEHVQAIKKLFESNHTTSSSSQAFFKTPLSGNHINAHAIRWRVCAMHLCLELCPSLNEHPDIKHLGLDALFKSIATLRGMLAHQEDEKNFSKTFGTLETLFKNQGASILLEINSIKFGLAPLKKA